MRNGLLITTALVLCVSTAFAAQKPEKPGKPILQRLMNHGIPVIVRNGFPATVMTTGKTGQHPNSRTPERLARGVTYNTIDEDDANAQFVSWYGGRTFKTVSCYSSSNFHSCINTIGTNAIPITGLGYKARKITVPIDSLTGSGTEFNVGIYGATASGLPGSELAGASTTASPTNLCCSGLRTVPVNIKLKAGQPYFVEVACGQNAVTCEGAWDMESLDWSGGKRDFWHFEEHVTYNFGSGTYSSNYSSPWHGSGNFDTNPAAKVY